MVDQLSAMKEEVDRMETRKLAKEKLEMCELMLMVEEAKAGKALILLQEAKVTQAMEQMSVELKKIEPHVAAGKELKKKQVTLDPVL